MNIAAPTHGAGMSSSRLARLDGVMQRYIDQGRFPGVQTLVYRRGQVVQRACYGVKDLEARSPLAPDTIYRIFSMSKPVTCAAVMTLYEEGHFRLYDPIEAYIPAFKNTQVFSVPVEGGIDREQAHRPILIHDLLTHTAGLAYGLEESTPVDILYRRARILRTDETLAEKVKRLAELPLMFHPGTRYSYSIAIDVLGRLVEVVSGKSLDVYLKERIFDPLGMVDTGFMVPPEKLNRLAAGYILTEDGRFINFLDPDAKQRRPAADADGLGDVGEVAGSPGYQPKKFLSGGGGLVSTVDDYLRFARMLLQGGELEGQRILGRKTVAHMTLNQLPDGLVVDPGRGMGYGVGVTFDPAQSMALISPGSFGWGGAAGTDWWADPREDLIGILMVQTIPGWSSAIQADFRTLVLQAIED